MKKILALSLIGGTVAMLFTGCTQRTIVREGAVPHARPIVINQGLGGRITPTRKVIVERRASRPVIIERKPVVIQKNYIRKVYPAPTVINVNDDYYDDCGYYNDCY